MAAKKEQARKRPAFPKTPGEAIDLLYKTRSERLALEKQADDVKKLESALQEHILSQFDKNKLEGARGSLATATVTVDETAKVEDWDEFVKYVMKKKDFTLLHKRCSVTAVAERWANNELVPGIARIPVTKLHLTKR